MILYIAVSYVAGQKMQLTWSKLEFTGQELSLGIFNVTDKFAADQFRISLNFSDEGWHNVSVVAKNFFFTDNETLLDEVFTYHLTFEIVGKVTNLFQ